MSEILWINIPLMVLFIGLMAGIPLWKVQRHEHWHGKPEPRAVPVYLAVRPAARVRSGSVRLPRTAHQEGRISMRPLSGSANG
jgi:hypothetical protein